jgi:hypothetical protein
MLNKRDILLIVQSCIIFWLLLEALTLRKENEVLEKHYKLEAVRDFWEEEEAQ